MITETIFNGSTAACILQRNLILYYSVVGQIMSTSKDVQVLILPENILPYMVKGTLQVWVIESC